MKRNYYLLSIFCLLLLAACDKKKDRIFEESPTERLNVAVANAQTVLKSKPNGWIMQYYPGTDAQWGGFNLFVNFTSNTGVNLQADYTTANVTSTYKVYPGAGPILTFDTYNSVIGFFALPGELSKVGPDDTGLGGDLEFLVMKADADSVILKSRKRGNRIVMVPLPANPALIAPIIANYRTAFNRYFNFGSFKFETAKGQTALTWGYNNLKSATTNYSFRVTEKGIDSYKEYAIDGIKFRELAWNAATAGYPNGYYGNANGSIKLVPKP